MAAPGGNREVKPVAPDAPVVVDGASEVVVLEGFEAAPVEAPVVVPVVLGSDKFDAFDAKATVPGG